MWYEIGLSLKVSRRVLNDLRHSQESNIVKLDQVIQSWITTESHFVTWETVIDAIEGPIVNNKLVANTIRKHLADAKSQGISIYYSIMMKLLSFN